MTTVIIFHMSYIITVHRQIKVKKVKGFDIYIPPRTRNVTAVVYNLKWRTDRQWH